MTAAIEKASPDVICVSVVAPSTIIHARYLCLKLRAALPKLKIVVGAWSATENVRDLEERLQDSCADAVATTLADAIQRLGKTGSDDAAKTG